MSIHHILQKRALPLKWSDYSKWPKVDVRCIDEQHRDRFLALQDAAKLMCEGEHSLRDVHRITTIPPTTLSYYFNKALQLHEDGRINGERAFVRYQIRSEYTPSGEVMEGYSGQFKSLISQLPDLKDAIKIALVSGQKISDVHKAFKDTLYEHGFTDDDYPLNTDSQGEWSVRAYCKKLESEYFREIALAKGGRDAARNADTSQPMQLMFPVTRPYQRLELDAHMLHAIFTIDMEELDGTVRTATLKRLTIIAAIDSDTRAILGYRISMNTQSTIEDVVLTLAHVLDPLNDDAPDILGYVTGQGVGLPEALIEQCRFRVFDELALDNALAHTSPALHSCLIRHVTPTVNVGKSKHPEGRPLIEGWFKLLNRYLSDPLPSTTGSHPKDPKRRSPRKKALKYRISLGDLEALVETVIRHYNQQKPSTTHGRSPLDELRHRLAQRPGLVRTLRPCDQDLNFLFKRTYQATIAGSVARGERPYIQFLRAVYKNHQLSSMGALIGTKVTLIVDVRDLRCIEAVFSSGQSIGILNAQGGWAMTPHSLQTRRAINRHLNRERVRGTIGDYVRWYVANLAAKKKRNANTPNITTRINREIERGRARDAKNSTKETKDATPSRRSNRRWMDIGPDIELDEESAPWT